MSYILEALKKLEEKREQEDAPRMFIFSRPSKIERWKRPLWLYIIVAALLVNAFVMAWWAGGKRGEKTAALAEKASPPHEIAEPAPAAPSVRRQSRPAGKPERKRETAAFPALREMKPPGAADSMSQAPAADRNAQATPAPSAPRNSGCRTHADVVCSPSHGDGKAPRRGPKK